MKSLCEFGSYRLDFERRLLSRGEEPVQLPAKALDILLLLVQRRGEVVSKDDLMKAVWPETFVEEANLSQNIFVLRKALGERPQEHRYILTVPGRGYRFVASVQATSEIGGLAPEPDHVSTERNWIRQVVSWFRTERRLRKGWMIPLALAALALALTFVNALPWIARYYNNRGARLQQQGQIKAAIRDYQRALTLNPGYADAHYDLAGAYEEIPNYEKALDEYQLAIDADLTFYPAYNNLSRLYILRRRDYGAALRLLDRAFSLKPKETSVQYSLYKNYGWANFELHNLGQAEQNLRFAIGLNPDRGAAHCLLAKVLDAQGRVTGALGEWESCAAYSPSQEVEPEWRVEAQERLGREAVK